LAEIHRFHAVLLTALLTKQYIEVLFQNKGIIEQPPYVDIQSSGFERGKL
jgi:hypothetical protein